MIKNLINKIKKNVGFDYFDFLKHSSYYFVGTISIAFIAFIGIPIYTRLLSTSGYGVLAVFTSFISIFTILFGLGFKVAIKRQYFEETDDFQRALGSNILFLLLFNVGLFVVCFLLRGALSAFFGLARPWVVIALVISSQMVFFDVYLNLLQIKKKSKPYVLLTVMRRLFILILSVVWILQLKDEPYRGIIFSTLSVSSLLFLYALYCLKRSSLPSFDPEHIRYSFEIGIPLLPALLSSLILTSFDIIIIRQLLDNSYAGLYSFAYNIGMLLQYFVTAGSRSWQVVFLEKLKNADYKRLHDIAFNYSTVIFFLATGLILFAKELVLVIADKKFHSATHLIPVIISGYIFFFLYTLYGHYTLFRKKTYYNSIYAVICAIINIVLNYLFIPIYGYTAAAYTTLLSYIVYFCMFYYNAKYILHFKGGDLIPISRILPNFIYVILALMLFYFQEIHLGPFANGLQAFTLKSVYLLAVAVLLFAKRFFRVMESG